MAEHPIDDPADLDRILDEITDRHRGGEERAVAEWAAAYPRWEDELRELLPAMLLMEEVGGDQHAELPLDGRLGDFALLGEIGRGGMGVVYLAEQQSLQRRVALKVLSPAYRMDGPRLERFRVEAQLAARVEHPHIVPVHAVGEADGVPYFAMQCIRGRSLDRVVADLATQQPRRLRELDLGPGDGRLDFFRRVARLGADIADALSHAHQAGVLHRDIKPSNLLLDDGGKIWVTDFGLARTEDGAGLTRSGDVLGTLAYLAPECYRGWSDPRSDVYGLGLTLYELLTLRPAFRDTDTKRLIHRVLYEAPRRPATLASGLPRDLETIVLAAIAKEPRERYQSAAELRDDLRRFVAREPIDARRPGTLRRCVGWARRRPAVAALVFVLVASVLTVTGLSLMHNREVDAALRVQTDLRRDAQAHQREAQLHGLVLASEQAEGEDPMLALLLANAAAERGWTEGLARRLRSLARVPLERGYLGARHGAIRGVRVARDGVRMLVTQADGVALWDRTGAELARFVACGWADFDASGGRVVGIGKSLPGPLWIWDGSGKLLREVPAVLGVPRFAPDHQNILVTTVEGQRLVRLSDGEVLAQIDSEREVHFAGRRLLLGPDPWEWLSIPEGGSSPLGHVPAGQVALAPDGAYMLTFSQSEDGLFEGVARIGGLRWTDLRTATSRRLLDDRSYQADTRRWVHFAPDGSTFVTLLGAPRLFDREGRLLAVLLDETLDGPALKPGGPLGPSLAQRHRDGIPFVAYDPTGARVLVCHGRTVRLFDVRGRRLAEHRDLPLPVQCPVAEGLAPLVELEVPGLDTNPIRFAADGRRVLLAASGGVFVWDGAGAPLLLRGPHLGAWFRDEGREVLTWTGERLGVWAADGRAELGFHHRAPALLTQVRGAESSPVCLAPDGSRVASIHEDGVLCLWSGQGQLVRQLRPQPRGPEQAMFTMVDIDPGGSALLTVDWQDVADLWGVEGGHRVTLGPRVASDLWNDASEDFERAVELVEGGKPSAMDEYLRSLFPGGVPHADRPVDRAEVARSRAMEIKWARFLSSDRVLTGNDTPVLRLFDLRGREQAQFRVQGLEPWMTCRKSSGILHVEGTRPVRYFLDGTVLLALEARALHRWELDPEAAGVVRLSTGAPRLELEQGETVHAASARTVLVGPAREVPGLFGVRVPTTGPAAIVDLAAGTRVLIRELRGPILAARLHEGQRQLFVSTPGKVQVFDLRGVALGEIVEPRSACVALDLDARGSRLLTLDPRGEMRLRMPLDSQLREWAQARATRGFTEAELQHYGALLR